MVLLEPRRLGSQQARGAFCSAGHEYVAASSAADSAGESAVPGWKHLANALAEFLHGFEHRASAARHVDDLGRAASFVGRTVAEVHAAGGARPQAEPCHGGQAHERRFAGPGRRGRPGRLAGPRFAGPGRRGRLVWRGAASAPHANPAASSRRRCGDE